MLKLQDLNGLDCDMFHLVKLFSILMIFSLELQPPTSTVWKAVHDKDDDDDDYNIKTE